MQRRTDRSQDMIGKDAARRASFLEMLSRTQRLVLMLHFADELSPAEISTLIELPEEDVCAVITTLRDLAAEARPAPATSRATEGGREGSLATRQRRADPVAKH